jgi:hypothetical protein
VTQPSDISALGMTRTVDFIRHGVIHRKRSQKPCLTDLPNDDIVHNSHMGISCLRLPVLRGHRRKQG